MFVFILSSKNVRAPSACFASIAQRQDAPPNLHGIYWPEPDVTSQGAPRPGNKYEITGESRPLQAHHITVTTFPLQCMHTCSDWQRTAQQREMYCVFDLTGICNLSAWLMRDARGGEVLGR